MSAEDKNKEQLLEKVEDLKKEGEITRLYLDTAEVMVVVLDKDRKVSFVNKKTEEVLECKKNEILGKEWFKTFLPKRIAAETATVFCALMAGDRPDLGSHTNLVLTKTGEEKSIKWNNTVMKDAAGNIVSIVGTGIDVTQEEKMRKEMESKEKKYRTLFDFSRDALMTLAPPEWKFTSANEAAVKLFEAGDEATLIAKGPGETSPGNQPDGELSSAKAKRMIEKAMDEGSNFFEWEHRTFKGKVFPATVMLSKIEIEGEERLQATVRDCTEQKKAEDAIKKYIDSLPGLFYVFDEERFVLWNKQWESVSGYSSEEIRKMYGTDFFEGSDKKLIEEKMKEVFIKGVSSAEAHLTTKQGKRIPYYFTGVRKEFDGKEYLIGLGVDITKKMETEEALKKSEATFRLMAERTTDFVALTTFDTSTTFLYVNPAYERVLGYEKEDLVGTSAMDFILPEDKIKHMPMLLRYVGQQAKKMFTGKEMFVEERIEWRVRDKKEGEIHIMRSTINVAGDKLIFVSQDITKSKAKEEKEKKRLKEMEVFYKASRQREERILELKEKVRRLEEKIKAKEEK